MSKITYKFDWKQASFQLVKSVLFLVHAIRQLFIVVRSV